MTSGSVGSSRICALRLVEVGVVLDRRRLQHPVHVVEDQPDVAQPSHARLRAHRRQADLDARVAERAFLGLAGLVVEVDLLVRAAGHTHPPAAAAVLVDQHDAVLGALVHRPRRTRRHARRVEAVLADPRQVEHERLLEFEADLFADLLQDRVAAARSPGSPPRSSSQFADHEIFIGLPVIRLRAAPPACARQRVRWSGSRSRRSTARSSRR